MNKIYIFTQILIYPFAYTINFLLKYFNFIILFRGGRQLGDMSCITGIVSNIEKYNILLFTYLPEIFQNNKKLYKNYKINPYIALFLKILRGKNIKELNFKHSPHKNLHDFIKANPKFQSKHLAFFISNGLLNDFDFYKFKNEFFFSENEIKMLKKKYEFLGKNYALINPNSKDSYTKTKDWGFENYQKVVNLTDFNWIQVGTANEKLLKNIKNLNGETNIRELLYLVSKSKFVLGNEGYLNHISSSFENLSFVVMSGFTKTEHVRYKNTIFISREPQIECAPCFITGSCDRIRKYCTEDIEVDKVIKIIINNFDVRSEISKTTKTLR